MTKENPTPDELSRWLATSEGFLQGLTDVDERPTRLTGYQLDHLRDASKFRAREKARGVGFSFVCAAEALAKARLRRDYTAIFVSMNLEEAVEKIRYANLLYNSLPLKWQKKKVVDNKTSLEFEDPSGRYRSRLISHPCKDPRGKHKADVFLDEFAHYGHKQRAIYVAAVPIVSRGDGQLTIGSTPLMVGDLFHEIMKQERRKYPMFTRQSVPWWACPEFCTDVARAKTEAESMETAERVHAFGQPTLVDIFHTMEVDDFRQEYELSFNDESQTFFPYDLIFACCDDGLDAVILLALRENAPREEPGQAVDVLHRVVEEEIVADLARELIVAQPVDTLNGALQIHESLLGRQVEDLDPPLRQVAQDLDGQRRLSDARLAREQVDAAPDESRLDRAFQPRESRHLDVVGALSCDVIESGHVPPPLETDLPHPAWQRRPRSASGEAPRPSWLSGGASGIRVYAAPLGEPWWS